MSWQTFFLKCVPFSLFNCFFYTPPSSIQTQLFTHKVFLHLCIVNQNLLFIEHCIVYGKWYNSIPIYCALFSFFLLWDNGIIGIIVYRPNLEFWCIHSYMVYVTPWLNAQPLQRFIRFAYIIH